MFFTRQNRFLNTLENMSEPFNLESQESWAAWRDISQWSHSQQQWTCRSYLVAGACMSVWLSTLGSVMASESLDWALLLFEIVGPPQQERGFQLSQFLLHRVCCCLFFLIYWSKASFAWVYHAGPPKANKFFLTKWSKSSCRRTVGCLQLVKAVCKGKIPESKHEMATTAINQRMQIYLYRF